MPLLNRNSKAVAVKQDITPHLETNLKKIDYQIGSDQNSYLKYGEVTIFMPGLEYANFGAVG